MNTTRNNHGCHAPAEPVAINATIPTSSPTATTAMVMRCHNALRTFADLLAGGTDSSRSYSYQALIDAEDYVGKWVELPDGETGLLFNEITGRTTALAEVLSQDYGQLNNARIDAIFADVKPEAGIPDFVDYIMQPTGLLSPTHWILKLLDIFGIRPVEVHREREDART